jgi:hypothetical protein
MTRRIGESRVRWLKRLTTTFIRGFPAFRTSDRVAIVDDAARTVLGDDTGTVEVVAPFGGWEYRVVADNPDPDAWIPNVRPEEGQLLTAEQIEPISPDGRENGQ